MDFWPDFLWVLFWVFFIVVFVIILSVGPPDPYDD